MRLTLRIAMLLGMVLASVLGVRSYFEVGRRLEAIDHQLRNDQELLAEAIGPTLARTVRTDGTEAARYLVANLDDRHSERRLRWVVLADDDPQSDSTPRDPRAAADALQVTTPVTSFVEQPNERAMYTYIRIDSVGDEAPGILEVRRRLTTRTELAWRVGESEALAAMALLVVTFIGVVLLGGWFVGRPVSQLVDHAQRVGEGDLSGRLGLRRRDEIGQLALAMNEMTERLEVLRDEAAKEAEAKLHAVRQLRHAERLAAIGQLSAGIAHEIGSPLNVVLGHAELIHELVEHEGAKKSANKIADQVERISKILGGLMRFAGDREAKMEDVDLTKLVEESCDLLQMAARDAKVELEGSTDDCCGGQVHGDAGQLQQVLTNLILNAIQACRPGDRVGVSCESTEETYTLIVQDDGCGIPDDLVDRIFDPFVTTKDVGSGTGLGLAVSYGIVKEHGGDMTVDSEPGVGTTFVVSLPKKPPVTEDLG